MNVLLDTNLHLRLSQPDHAQHQVAVSAVETLQQRGDILCLVPQIAYEFWVVATRPSGENGLGLTIAQTHAELSRIRKIFPMHNDTEAILSEWERLVVKHQVIGKSSHDARLVAAMIVHKLTQILSFNYRDFQRYQEITAINPEEVVAPPAT